MRRENSDGCTPTAQEYKLIEICSNPIAWYDTLSPEEKATALRCAVSGNVAAFAKLLSKALQDVTRQARQPVAAVQVNNSAFVFA